MVKLPYYLVKVLLLELFLLNPVKLEIDNDGDNNVSFNHTAEMDRHPIQIKYGNVEVVPSGVVCSHYTTNVPEVSWEADSAVLYVLIMFDEIQPSDEITLKSHIHWLIVDIPGSKINQGRVVAPYYPPEPLTKESQYRSIAIRIYGRNYPITVRKLNEYFKDNNGKRSLDVDTFAEEFQLNDPVVYQQFNINFREDCQ